MLTPDQQQHILHLLNQHNLLETAGCAIYRSLSMGERIRLGAIVNNLPSSIRSGATYKEAIKTADLNSPHIQDLVAAALGMDADAFRRMLECVEDSPP